jgi:hypothetical protein
MITLIRIAREFWRAQMWLEISECNAWLSLNLELAYEIQSGTNDAKLKKIGKFVFRGRR